MDTLGQLHHRLHKMDARYVPATEFSTGAECTQSGLPHQHRMWLGRYEQTSAAKYSMLLASNFFERLRGYQKRKAMNATDLLIVPCGVVT